MRASLLVRTQPTKARSVADALMKEEDVVDAFTVFGTAEVAARIETDGFGALDGIVTRTADLDGVVETEALPELVLEDH